MRCLRISSLGLLLTLNVGPGAFAQDVWELVRGHETNLAAIRSLRADVVVTTQIGAEAPVVSETIQWIKDGYLERHFEHPLKLSDAQGKPRPLPGTPRVLGCDERYVRVLMSMEGINLAELVQQRLVPGESEYLSTKCSITPRDPTSGRTIHRLLRFVVVLKPLRNVLEDGEILHVGETDHTGTIDVQTKDFGHIRLELDKQHGYLLRRTEYRQQADQQEPTSVAEIEVFREEGGVWFPIQVAHFNSAGRLVARVEKLSLNVPVPREDLIVRFPEGARVDDGAGLIHVWGANDAPAASYRTFDEYAAAELRREEAEGLSDDPAMWWLIVVNVVGISAIAIVMLTLRYRRVGN